jgi:hypothetical protein
VSSNPSLPTLQKNKKRKCPDFGKNFWNRKREVGRVKFEKTIGGFSLVLIGFLLVQQNI